MTHSAWWMAVNVLATYRLAILLSKDKIAFPLRKWVWRRGWHMEVLFESTKREYRVPNKGRLGSFGRAAWELMSCAWCVSIWFAGIAVALTATVPGLWQWPALALALSGVTVLWTRVD